MKIDGGCHCGAVRYEAQAEPEKAGICHCTDCQALSGSPYVAYIQVPAAGFKLLRGQPKVYVKVAESGNRRAQAFCPDCGSRLWAAAEKDTPVYNLRLGGVRQRAQLAPQTQVWCGSALPWSMDLGAVRKHAKQAG
jgi:hypothetical protein